ncbi:hypothetical protein RRG08_026140 [Elysia crispata]|uniref:DDE-1 domain-containing protein n=1 Tax=Elysia crispata TaxID=231223 RepID=A0AAE0ZA40_9GAST|nr:hypothetical protein RRG08_026140 [Elysia crispata]
MPLEKRDVKLIISWYLQRTDTKISAFTDNIPGDDWVDNFIKRHDVLTNRVCQNIKRSRAEDVKKYFTNLKASPEGVPSGNIVNYDKTNLSDEPGSKKCIFRRGVKYTERVINFSKGYISLMFAGIAEDELLLPFVVYKAAHLYESWRQGGPKGTRYARSKSGWFDAACFEEWFLTVIVPWARRRVGPKVMVRDNLSSHLSETVINTCQEFNIRFVLLPPNSTDKWQPLDVSFFGPLKREEDNGES